MGSLIAGFFIDRILVAADSYSSSLGSGRAMKLFPLSHLPTVITGRGSAGLLAQIALDAG